MNYPDLECNCGNTSWRAFKFIGVQPVPDSSYHLNLYNCLKCRTTISRKVLKGEQLPDPRGVHESALLYDLESRN